MSDRTLRQNYFKILSGLYDLASEFSVEELDRLEKAFLDRGNISHATVIRALAEIHKSTALGAAEPMRANERLSPNISTDYSSRGVNVSATRRAAALRDLLMTKELLPTPVQIAKIIPIDLAIKEKESREKYVGRVVATFRNLSSVEQESFISKVVAHLSARSGRTFVSKWSNLIRDL
jgi:hypothetical protein